MMTGREKLRNALNHEETSLPPIDFGSTAVTGMHVDVVHRLRYALTGDSSYSVKVIEPYQMLGEIDPVLRQALGIDVVGLAPRKTLFGFENQGWKTFRLFSGIEVMVPESFRTTTADNGDLFIYPEGDLSAQPSGRMPNGGHFFDTIVRQPPIDEERLDPADNLEEFTLFTKSDLTWYEEQTTALGNLEEGVILTMPGLAFGDIALVPVPWMKYPKGIRDVEEWYASTVLRQDYILQIFEKQCEIGLSNLEMLASLLGDRVQAVFLTGTDFGTQRGLFISPEAYRTLYKPFHQQVNAFVHEKTNWHTFIHSCGAVAELIPEFIEAGFDILNPVQCSATGMEANILKREFGDKVTFWGGGVNTQQTLQFGTPEQVRQEVRERLDVFGAGGGFVFNAVHNIQATTPLENLLAMFETLRNFDRS